MCCRHTVQSVDVTLTFSVVLEVVSAPPLSFGFVAVGDLLSLCAGALSTMSAATERFLGDISDGARRCVLQE